MTSINEQVLPDANTVHIWTVDLEDMLLDLPELLSDDEIYRFSRINHRRARNNFLRSRAATRLILASYLRCAAADIGFSYNENGRPEISSFAHPGLRFNLSHSGNYCLLVVNESDIGVDVERLHDGRDYAALAGRFFTSAEHDLLNSSADKNLFYRMWVLKEASVKARGIKLLAGLDRFQCSISEAGVLKVIDKLSEDLPGSWSARQWQPDDRSTAAVVVKCAEADYVEKNLGELFSNLS